SATTLQQVCIFVEQLKAILNIDFVLILFMLSSFFPSIFTFAIIVIIVIFRIRKVIQGTKLNVKKTIIFSAYFVAITSFLLYNSFLIVGLPFAYVIPYFAIALGAAYCSYGYSKGTLSFRKLP